MTAGVQGFPRTGVTGGSIEWHGNILQPAEEKGQGSCTQTQQSYSHISSERWGWFDLRRFDHHQLGHQLLLVVFNSRPHDGCLSWADALYRDVQLGHIARHQVAVRLCDKMPFRLSQIMSLDFHTVVDEFEHLVWAQLPVHVDRDPAAVYDKFFPSRNVPQGL